MPDDRSVSPEGRLPRGSVPSGSHWRAIIAALSTETAGPRMDEPWYACERVGDRYVRLSGPLAFRDVLDWLVEHGHVERQEDPEDGPFFKGWGTSYFACVESKCAAPSRETGE